MVHRFCNITLSQPLAFYNTMQSNVMHEQRRTDVALRDYIKSFYTENEVLIEQMRLAAENENDDIDNTELQNNNDKQINAAYLTVSRLGLEGLSAAELGFITALANNCPYIAGPAVYKAREINTLLQPGRIYDDLKECNTQGVFRLADTSSVVSMSPYTQENQLLQSISAKPVIAASNATCNVYPNPSTGLFYYTISSSLEVASVSIYNSIGAIIDSKVTKASNTEGAIDITDKAIGIYTYKIATNGGKVFTGKLILQ